MATFKKGKAFSGTGDIKDKMAAAGLEHGNLVPYLFTYEEGEVEIHSLIEQIADAVLDVAKATYPAEVINADTINGTDYTDHYRIGLCEELLALALSTAVQGRAYKAAVVANNELATPEMFIDTSKKPAGTAKKADDGADALAAAMANLG